jgi:hypothetical protein
MHCPNCANESDLNQNFCRKCGFNLVPVTKLMLAGGVEVEESNHERVDRDKLLLRRMVSWMMWGMLILLMGVVVLVVKKQLQLDQWIGLIGTLIALAGASVATYGLLDAMRGGCFKKPQPHALAASPEHEVEPASTTNELEGRLPVPIGSVTERTTQLIGADTDRAS